MFSLSWVLGSPTTHLPDLAPPPPSSDTMAELRSRLVFLRDLSVRCLSLIFGDGSLRFPCMAASSSSAPSPTHYERAMLTNDASRSVSRLLAVKPLCVEASVSSPPPSLRVTMNYEMKNICMMMDQKTSYVGLQLQKPSVEIDNVSDDSASVIKVEDPCDGKSLVHILNIFKNLNLEIQRSYLMTDGPNCFYAFHITDSFGQKIFAPWIFYQIETRLNLSLSSKPASPSLSSSADIELTSVYHPDIIPLTATFLLSSGFQIESLHSRKYGSRLAVIIRIKSQNEISHEMIKKRLIDLVKGFEKEEEGFRVYGFVNVMKTCELVSMDRRLFWLAMDDLCYNKDKVEIDDVAGLNVSVSECKDSGYILVTVEEEKKKKDMEEEEKKEKVGRTSCAGTGLTMGQSAVVSTILDLGYEIRHGTANPAYQEYHIRADKKGLAPDELKNLKKFIQLSLSFSSSSLEGCRVFKRSIIDIVEYLKGHKGDLKEARWYMDGSTTMAQFVVEKETEEVGEEWSHLRRFFGLGSVFLRGLTSSLKLYARTL